MDDAIFLKTSGTRLATRAGREMRLRGVGLDS
jgi:hypothetical protein